jgi:hypothetical protein
MDINKIQKLNQMAINLQKHNIVNNKDDAINRAAKLYGEQYNYSSENIETAYENNNDYLKRDIRKLTFALRDALLEIKDLKQHVGRLDRQFNDLRVNNRPQVVQRVVQKPIVEPVKEQRKVDQQESKNVQSQFVTKERKITSAVDRNGIAPSEVSIDKFFYYGQS